MSRIGVVLGLVALAALGIVSPAAAQQPGTQRGAQALSAPALSSSTLAAALSNIAVPSATPTTQRTPLQAAPQTAQQTAQQTAIAVPPPRVTLPPIQRPATPPRTAPNAAPAPRGVAQTAQRPSPSGAAASAPITTSPSVDTMLTKLAPQMDLRVGGQGAGGLRLSGTVGIVVMMGLLTLLPTLLLLMTGFTRILIVLHFLRQALGTQNAPPAHLIAALALILTGFVMAPTLSKANETALQPWMDGKMEQGEMMRTAVIPFRDFMLTHTRDHDLQVFIDMSAGPQPRTENDIPLVTLVSAFATSELRTAFQIGFALFLPFIIIDIVVSSVLMSMGMFMLPPAMISLPFKLLLFVLVDGWTLVIQSLVTSFRV